VPFENSDLGSCPHIRTKLVCHIILDGAVQFFSGVQRRVGKLAFAPDSTPPPRWPFARKTLEDGREVCLSAEADAKLTSTSGLSVLDRIDLALSMRRWSR
jgi:hypothetical protein